MKKLCSIFRLTRAFWLIFRAGLFSSVVVPSQVSGFAGLFSRFICRISPKFQDDKAHKKINKLATKLGPSYIKLGQFLATRPDLVGNIIAKRLEPLQDRVAFFDNVTAVKVIETSLEDKIENIFNDFSNPIAAASIAQVHKGQVMCNLPSLVSEEVAIKIIRPKVRQKFFQDIKDFYLLARLQERFIKSSRRLRPVEVIATLDETTRMELDLRIEAAAICEMAENTKNDATFRVPKVIWSRTTRDILTTEWINAIKLTDMHGIDAAGIDRRQLANNLMQNFLLHALRDGFFHADMHAGNLFVDKQGCIIAIDFGIMGRLSEETRHFLAKILYGFVQRDYLTVAKLHIEAGYVPSNNNVYHFAQALRSVIEPIHGQSSGSISMGKLLAVLFEVTASFNMETQPQLLLLQKTMVMVEGNARQLDSDFNLWDSAKPILESWIKENLGAQAYLRQAKEALKFWAEFNLNYPNYHQNKLKQEQANQQRLQAIESYMLANNKKNRLLTASTIVILGASAMFMLANYLQIFR